MQARLMRQLADGFEEAGREGNLLPELTPKSGRQGHEHAARGVQSYGAQQASETGDPMLGLSFDLARTIQTTMAKLRVQLR
jgi:hypothetical protein